MSPETTALLAAARRVHEEYIASAARLRATVEVSHHTIASSPPCFARLNGLARTARP
jgi:hypothetical protein